MCGIAGFCNATENWKENIERMNARMFHRGPDGNGVWSNHDNTVVLGHQRLSIIDLSSNGTQPMLSHSGRYAMVFNGEIYNYKTIAEKLMNEGKVKTFIGTSDTEVLLEAFEAYGIEATLTLSKGMFAIALYDISEEVLYLMRDRVGEKPLYYGFVNNTFAFASEIGVIAEIEGFANDINTDILDTYFVHGYIPAPWTIYEKIYKLTPGTVLKIESPFKEYSISPYWSMREVALKGQKNKFKGSEQEAADELERLLKEAIKEQMVADVPVGAFLSAGIDSTTIVALMQSLNSDKIRTFTIGMNEKGYNEADVAKQIAEHLGTKHTEWYIDESEAKKVIPNLAHIFGEPFADSSQIPTYLVSKMTREHVTVSLSGDAGDELFCGYGSYDSVERIWNKMKGVPYCLRKPVSSLVLSNSLIKNPMVRTKANLLAARDPVDLYDRSNEQEPLVKRICLKDGLDLKRTMVKSEVGILDVNQCIMLEDLLMYHPDDILVKVDRTAMAVSLETRVPMLDRDVIEFAWTLPIEYLKKDGVRKKVLKDVLYKYVPQELMERPKKGFGIPIEKWLRESELRAWAEALLDKDLIRKQGILDADVVHRIWSDFIERGIWRIQIWYILMFQEWMVERV